MNLFQILRNAIPSNQRGADMKRRREARLQRTQANADPLAGYVDYVPTASTPQPAEREMTPQRRWVPGSWTITPDSRN